MSISSQLSELVLQRDYLMEKAVDFGCTLVENPTIIQIAEALAPSDYNEVYSGVADIEDCVNVQLSELVLQRDYLANVVTHLGFELVENPTIREIADALLIPAYAAVYGGDTLVFGRGDEAPATYGGKTLTEQWSKVNGYDIENVDYSQIYDGYVGSEGIPWRSYTTYEDSMTFEYFYSPIKSVVFVDSVAPKSTAYWFCNLDMCTNFNLQNLDTSRTTSMQGMFNGCFYMTHLDLSSFDTSSVTNMKAMFYYCHNLNSLDLSSFNTSSVADVKSMFGSCSSLTTLDLSSFNTSSVTNMNSMFSDCSSLTTLDLSGFNTSSVADMRGMFGGCSELATIYASEFWNIGAATLTLGMFRNCNNLKGDIAFDSSYPIDKTYAKTSGGYLTYKAAPQ